MSSTTIPTIEGYEAVIGIECHVELTTRSKMFCGCANIFGAEPNTNVCPVCLGMPGSLPVPNRAAIEKIVLAGLAFGGKIASFSKFDRKNYFYPDMPKNYQISQYDLPFVQGGVVTYWLPDGTRGTCRLTRIHMEEDTGKSVHASQDGRIAGSTSSLLDFNRAGVPLMECVSEPDIRSAAEAVAFLEALRRTFVGLGVSDVKMEEGSLRCDANVSIRPCGSTEFGTKAEIKNMNSFRSVHRAIESEIARQVDLITRGERVIQETRGWDEAAGRTHTMRSKEQAHDYRYFPDPDLVPITFTDEQIAAFRASSLSIPPQQRLERLIEEDGISAVQAHQLVDTPGLVAYYDTAVERSGRPQATLNFVLGDLARLANESGTPVAASRVTPEAIAEIVGLSESGKITSKTGKELITRLWNEGGSPTEIVEREGLAQENDAGVIEELVREVLAAQPKSVADVRAGNKNVLRFLVGQVMKASRGKANPVLVEERLRSLIAQE
ncbi:MAG TPA: Asp-tRNA(Asn)/Glu-tRNA(Gln) amidotransferase subunit GatB [Candidatus Baltobacteraceae bacterium]|nr:Asp-tRNA(Asn)/Glu-tRNA(Gln) amidotransferase subunit GatB [Candidatus Baltobacteraceae bacterium]